jgi:hypothetical protein
MLVRQDSSVDHGEVAGAVGHGLGGDAAVEGGEAASVVRHLVKDVLRIEQCEHQVGGGDSIHVLH